MFCVFCKKEHGNGNIKILTRGFKLMHCSLVWSAPIPIKEMERYILDLMEQGLQEEDLYELIKDFVLRW